MEIKSDLAYKHITLELNVICNGMSERKVMKHITLERNVICNGMNKGKSSTTLIIIIIILIHSVSFL